MSIDVRDRFEDLMLQTLALRREMGGVSAGARGRRGISIGEDEQDELSPIEEQARFGDLKVDERNEKMALVRESLGAGIYSVSARAVASRILDATFPPGRKC